MTGWEGLGARLRQAIKAKGPYNDKGEPDVQRFAIDNGWVPNYLYRHFRMIEIQRAMVTGQTHRKPLAAATPDLLEQRRLTRRGRRKA